MDEANKQIEALQCELQNFMRYQNEFQNFITEKEEKIKLEQKQNQAFGDLMSSFRHAVKEDSFWQKQKAINGENKAVPQVNLRTHFHTL